MSPSKLCLSQSWDYTLTPALPSCHSFSLPSLPLTLRQRFKAVTWIYQLHVLEFLHFRLMRDTITIKPSTAQGWCALAGASLGAYCSPAYHRGQGSRADIGTHVASHVVNNEGPSSLTQELHLICLSMEHHKRLQGKVKVRTNLAQKQSWIWKT